MFYRTSFPLGPLPKRQVREIPEEAFADLVEEQPPGGVAGGGRPDVNRSVWIFEVETASKQAGKARHPGWISFSGWVVDS